jgi:hypothetical protein
MTEYDNTNSGALFRDENATGNQPEYTGKINVDGKDMRLAAWVKESSNTGKKFFSIRVSEFSKVQPQSQQSGGGELDDDSQIPF